jgi:hypothetical protein
MATVVARLDLVAAAVVGYFEAIGTMLDHPADEGGTRAG